MDEQNEFVQRGELLQKFIDKYNALKRESDELAGKYERLARDSAREVQRERDARLRSDQETQRAQKSMRELKQELSRLQQQLANKDNENREVQKRLEVRLTYDERTRDRDQQIFLKFLGRRPVSTNSQDQKLMTILSHFENERERLEREVKSANERAAANSEATLAKASSNSSLGAQQHAECAQRIQQVELELQSVQQENETVKRQNTTLKRDCDTFYRQNQELRRTCESFQKEIAQGYRLQQSAQEFSSLNGSAQREKCVSNNNFKNSGINNDSDSLLPKNELQPYYADVQQLQEQEQFAQQQRRLETVQEQDSLSALEFEDSQIFGDANTVLTRLFQIFNVDSTQMLVQAALKTEQVMKAIPRLEMLVRQICQIVLRNGEGGGLESLVPTIQQWSSIVTYVEQFLHFKDRLARLLRLRVGTDSNNNNSEGVGTKNFRQPLAANTLQFGSQAEEDDDHSRRSAEQAAETDDDLALRRVTENDILTRCEELLAIEKQASANAQDLQQIDRLKNAKHIAEFVKLFGIDDDNSVTLRMNQVFRQLQDIQKFIKIARQLLVLDPDMREEAVLTYIMRVLEKMKMNKYNDPDLMLKLTKILKLDDPSLILQRVTTLAKNSNISASTSELVPQANKKNNVKIL